MALPEHPVTWLRDHGQHLGLVPSLGGGVAAWQIDHRQAPDGRLDLWRRWDETRTDRYALASFAMLPWSNRISGGGFEHGGRFHPIALNRPGEPCPIHGDGWLQPWALSIDGPDTARMTLESHRHEGNPYDYAATQTFALRDGGLDQTVEVTHLGDEPLPYGLGLHPWFPRSPQTRLHAPVQGVWLCGNDPLPTAHSTEFPPSWDLNGEADVSGGPLIDNAYTGWSGRARIRWPEQGVALTMAVPDFQRPGAQAGSFCLLYRPPQGPAFCFEPVTQPIDAFHLPGRPGLRVLSRGDRLTLHVEWRFQAG